MTMAFEKHARQCIKVAKQRAGMTSPKSRSHAKAKRREEMLKKILYMRCGASYLMEYGIITDAQHSAAYTKANELIDLLGKP